MVKKVSKSKGEGVRVREFGRPVAPRYDRSQPNARAGKSVTTDLPPVKSADKTSEPENRLKPFLSILGWCLWAAFAFLAAQFIVALILLPLDRTGVIDVGDVGAVGNAVIQAGSYVLMLLIAIAIPLRRTRKKTGNTADTRKAAHGDMGVSRWPDWEDLLFTLANVPVFYITLLAVSIAAQFVLGPEIMTQTQEIGFSTTGNSWWQLVIIGVALAGVAPLAEELLLRGFLFSKLRKVLRGEVGFWVTAIIISLLFALAHMQINVGIMTFILSMFACRLREKTGAIWAGVGLHATVNLVAFGIQFLGWFGGAS